MINMEELHRAITAGNENFMAGFSLGDAAVIAACYTRDAKLFPPNSQIISGSGRIKAFWQGEMNLGIKERELETSEVESGVDLAVEVGQYRLKIQSEGGDKVTETGKYVVVWKKDGESWKMHIDIWNASPAT
jgi:ketosteroid isomerase-like protein